MTIPDKFLVRVEERIQSGAESKDKNDQILAIAQLELLFLKAKQNLLSKEKENTHLANKKHNKKSMKA